MFRCSGFCSTDVFGGAVGQCSGVRPVRPAAVDLIQLDRPIMVSRKGVVGFALNGLGWTDDHRKVMKRLTILGFGLTAVWVLIFGIVIYLRSSNTGEVSLNEWGDFLAGASAPLALLWLVIGYFQHGDELRLNTEALQLQQKELKLQVKETANLVDAANRQAQAAYQDLEDRREREAREAEPEFVSGVASFSPNEVSIELKNRGGEARMVSLSYAGIYQPIFPPKAYIETNGPPARLVFRPRRSQPLDFPIRFTIKSTDRLGHRHDQEFVFFEEGILERTRYEP